MKKIDEWTNKSNALLYSMIPESIANRLKKGEDPIKTCEVNFQRKAESLKKTQYIQ